MERDHQIKPKQQQLEIPKSTLLPTQNPREIEIAYTDSPRNAAAAAAASDRLKRDEWSEGAVSSLLEAYEAKWTLRNRAKLKGQDWEDVARHVSSRAAGGKSAKTQTQCKNKIESMKKRYRSESAAAADASSWPLYPRLDLLLRGNGAVTAATAAAAAGGSPNPTPVVDLQPPPPPPPPPPAVFEIGCGAQVSPGSNGGDRVGKEEEGDGTNNEGSERKQQMMNDETDSSTPAMDLQREKGKMKRKAAAKREREERWEVGESMRLLAEVVVRSEQSRMETMREIERMRAEAEAKRGEMDLKRTEIIANTQLQIAKLFARGSIQ